MLKKIIVTLLLVALVGAGAFAQLVVGGSGALHMTSQLKADEVAARFKTGEGIFYGPFVEIISGNLGVGASLNASFFKDMGIEFMDYDFNAYLAYHIFGGKAFLDPFGEVGFGMLANDYANASEDPMDGAPNAANLYWYGALGVGINLGPIGIFGKMSYNNRIDSHLKFKDDLGIEQEIPYYGEWLQDTSGNWYVKPFVPDFRFTLGAKVLL